MKKGLILLGVLVTLPLLAGERKYRKFVLPNGLKVVLVSDPEVNVSAASLDVNVGSIADPPHRLGLAHFLEHMLFLATEKYPKLNSYGEFLKANGGYSNAFTAEDHTNYHFQVRHEAFAEALDRFAQFFISPLLDYKYAKREVMAVHSEHQKNIPEDSWRYFQLIRLAFRKAHPSSKFHTGCLETLKGTTEKELRQFFEAYYSPENMSLCLISRLSLDEQERLVRKIFSQIPKRQGKVFSADHNLLEEKPVLRLFFMKPVKNLRELRIFIPLPPLYKAVGEKTHRLLGMTMGDEGKGSLLSYLKSKGYATALSAGIGNNRYYSSLGVRVSLTQKGYENWKEVLRLCFAYFEMLRKSPYPKHIWEEMKILAELRQKYSPRGEGASAAIQIATHANLYGLEIAEKVEYYFTRPNEKAYRKLLALLRPDRAIVTLIAPSVKTNKREKWYGTEYSYQEVKEWQDLLHPSVPSSIHLPLPNPFIPKDTSLIAEQPVLIEKSAYATLWYGQDTVFRRPKVAIYLHILSPLVYQTARNWAAFQLYVALVKEKLNEYTYPALMADLSFELSPTEKGLFLSIQGYSYSAFELLKIIEKKLRSTDFPSSLFHRTKESLLRSLQNFAYQKAYFISREWSRKINLNRYYLPNEWEKELRTLTPSDISFFVESLYEKAHIQGLGYGNLKASSFRKAVYSLIRTLGFAPLPPEKVKEAKALWLPAGQGVYFYHRLPTSNSCLRLEYQVGYGDLKTLAASWMLARALRNAFYTEMRTRQMLGYIVFSGTYSRQGVVTMVFLIQSGTHPAEELYHRAEKFVQQIPKLLQSFPPRLWEMIRKSLIEERKKKAKSISEKAARFYHFAFAKKGNFRLLEEEIEAIQKVQRKDILQLVERMTNPKLQRKVVILLGGSRHPAPSKLFLSKIRRPKGSRFVLKK